MGCAYWPPDADCGFCQKQTFSWIPCGIMPSFFSDMARRHGEIFGWRSCFFSSLCLHSFIEKHVRFPFGFGLLRLLSDNIHWNELSRERRRKKREFVGNVLWWMSACVVYTRRCLRYECRIHLSLSLSLCNYYWMRLILLIRLKCGFSIRRCVRVWVSKRVSRREFAAIIASSVAKVIEEKRNERNEEEEEEKNI